MHFACLTEQLLFQSVQMSTLAFTFLLCYTPATLFVSFYPCNCSDCVLGSDTSKNHECHTCRHKDNTAAAAAV